MGVVMWLGIGALLVGAVALMLAGLIKRLLLAIFAVLAALTAYVFFGSAGEIDFVRAQERVLDRAAKTVEVPGMKLMRPPNDELDEADIRYGWFLDNTWLLGETLQFFNDLGGGSIEWKRGYGTFESMAFESSFGVDETCRRFAVALDKKGVNCSRDFEDGRGRYAQLSRVKYAPGVTGYVGVSRTKNGKVLARVSLGCSCPESESCRC